MTLRLRVLGFGEVGSRLALAALEAGHSVVAIDPDDAKHDRLANGGNEVSEALRSFVPGTLGLARELTGDDAFDATLVCVPTWDDGYRARGLEEALRALAPHLASGELVSIESTVSPGTTSSLLRPLLESQTHRSAGNDLFLVASPERFETTTAARIATIPKLVGGVTPQCTERGVAIYSQFVETVAGVADATTAEAAKLVENLYRFVNVALIDEIDGIFSALGVDTRRVVEAASSKPFGFQAFWPGIGAGGNCLPLAADLGDALGQRLGRRSSILKSAIAANDSAFRRVLDQIKERTRGRTRAAVLLLGLTYKSFGADIGGSAALRLADALSAEGFALHVLDPHATAATASVLGPLSTCLIRRDELRPRYDCVVVTAWHDDFADLDIDALSDCVLWQTGSRAPLPTVRSSTYSRPR